MNAEVVRAKLAAMREVPLLRDVVPLLAVAEAVIDLLPTVRGNVLSDASLDVVVPYREWAKLLSELARLAEG